MKLTPFVKNGVPTVTIHKLDEITGMRLIDVRTAEEFIGELGHINGATLKTLGPELETFLKSASKEEPTLFICRSGARSAAATQMAQSLGFKSVYNLEGGMIFWNERGLDVSFQHDG
jgi:rhodanese-related sulfurtransferase